jgi:hypothetical protein
MAGVYRFQAELTRTGRTVGCDVPADVGVGLGAEPVVAVVGTVAGEGFNDLLVPIRGGGRRLLVRAAVREVAGIAAGDTIEVVLERDPSQWVPHAPDDLLDALRAIDGAEAAWDRLPPNRKREITMWIADTDQTAARAGRIVRGLRQILGV